MWRQLSFFPAFLILLLVFLFMVTGLVRLQIVEGNQNYQDSLDNIYSKQVKIAPRGLIMDAKGVRLVENKYLYDITINSGAVGKLEFEKIVEIYCLQIHGDCKKFREDVKKRYEEALGKKKAEVSFLKGISEEEYLKLFDSLSSFSGVEYTIRSKRFYLDGEIYSHVLGYTGEPSQEDVAKGVNPDQKVGKLGIEKYYEDQLRGENGKEVIARGFDGSIRLINISSVISGNDIVLNIDDNWQKKLYQLLKSRVEENDAFSAAAVVLDAESGAVKSIVSFPSYDSNEFENGISQKDYQKYLNDKRLPLLDHSISVQVSPGSTFKTIVAASALQGGVITDADRYVSKGCESIDDRIKFCEADMKSLGDLNLYGAIARSSNLYFCNVGKKFNLKFGEGKGIQYLVDGVDKFGIGRQTGIDLENEASGNMSSPEFIQKNQGRDWYLGDMCNTVIGQGGVTASPVQMAVAIASFGNGGKIMRPTIMSKVMSPEGEIVYSFVPQEVGRNGIDQANIDILNKAMRGVVLDNSGVVGSLKNVQANLRIKTGSADASEKLSDGTVISGAHSWVVGLFNYQGRDYSFAVVQYYGGRGYQTVPVVGSFVNCVNKDMAEGCEKY